VYSPYIGDGYIDFFINGEILYKPKEMEGKYGHGSKATTCEIEPDYMTFANTDTFSQLVISESAATCWLKSFAASDIGLVYINKQKANEMLGMDHLEFDTTFLAPHIPLFQEKMGADVPLHLDVSIKNPVVLFGQFDTDVIIEYTACMSWRADLLGATEVLYDELRMITSFDMKQENDINYIKLLNHKLDINSKFGTRTKPVRSSFDLTENEYRQFISTFGFTLNVWKKWLNEHYFEGGIYAPYNVEEFYTTVTFREKSMHIMLEVLGRADQFFEDYYNSSPYDYYY